MIYRECGWYWCKVLASSEWEPLEWWPNCRGEMGFFLGGQVPVNPQIVGPKIYPPENCEIKSDCVDATERG